MTQSTIFRRTLPALLLLILIATLIFTIPHHVQAQTFASPAFQKVWERTDKPVAEGKATRSWIWGAAPFKDAVESYKESPSGTRQVEYFDKARMEINNPGADQNGSYYVTNGLLVVELMTGRLQLGDNTFASVTPGSGAVAGDNASVNPLAPTYENMAKVATLSGNENEMADRTGQNVSDYITRYGDVTTGGDPHGITYAHYEVTLGHNIADVFWNFMNQKGTIWDAANQGYKTDTIVNWLGAMGYPITEAYWSTVKVGGQDKLVLIQAFQRRVLTFTPSNDVAWRVEMGNVGRHYDDWHSKVTGGSPTDTPVSGATTTPGPTNTVVLGATSTPAPQATDTVVPGTTSTPAPQATDTPLPTATNIIVPSPPTNTPTQVAATPVPTTSSGQTQITAGVDKPNPTHNSTVTVWGKLIVNGQAAAGANMDTTWHYKSKDSYCSGTAGSDGTASCSRDISRATSGYTVVIDVQMTYNGQTYHTSTSFTPQ